MRSRTFFLASFLLAAATVHALATNVDSAPYNPGILALAGPGDAGCVAAFAAAQQYAGMRNLILLRFGAKRYNTPAGRANFCMGQFQDAMGGASYEKAFTAEGTPLKTDEVRLSE